MRLCTEDRLRDGKLGLLALAGGAVTTWVGGALEESASPCCSLGLERTELTCCLASLIFAQAPGPQSHLPSIASAHLFLF